MFRLLKRLICCGYCYPSLQFSRNTGKAVLIFFLKIYLFIHSERAGERQRHRQREKQAPRRKPDAGLDPGSPGSHPGLQTALNCCATGAALKLFILLF